MSTKAPSVTEILAGLPLGWSAFESGYSARSDVVPATIDGSDSNSLWDEFSSTLALLNGNRTRLSDLLGFRTSQVSELALQSQASTDFEAASEFGVPTSTRAPSNVLRFGTHYVDYDKRVGYTRRFIENASAGQVEAIHQAVLEADNRLVFRTVMRPLLNNANGMNAEGVTVYGFWNQDGQVPPPSPDGVTFDATANHYLSSGAATVDSGDVEQLIDLLKIKGVGVNGEQLVLIANPQEAKQIRKFRAGVANNNGAVANADFVPSELAPAFWTTEHVVGEVPPPDFNGVPVIGSYAGVLVVETSYMPAGYLSIVASGGPGSANNPISIREHATPGLRGLRLIPGSNMGYPLIDSYYSRGIGAGVRRRSNGATIQIKASGSYLVPLQYL